MNGNIIFASVSVAISMTMSLHASSHILMTKIIIYVFMESKWCLASNKIYICLQIFGTRTRSTLY